MEAEINFSQMSLDLYNLCSALEMAVKNHFMSPEHAAIIWKRWLSLSGLDMPKVEQKKV